MSLEKAGKVVKSGAKLAPKLPSLANSIKQQGNKTNVQGNRYFSNESKSSATETAKNNINKPKSSAATESVSKATSEEAVAAAENSIKEGKKSFLSKIGSFMRERPALTATTSALAGAGGTIATNSVTSYASDAMNIKNQEDNQILAFNTELVNIKTEFDKVQKSLEEFCHGITIYSGVTPKKMSEFNKYKKKAEKLKARIENVTSRFEKFKENAENRNNILTRKPHLDESLQNFNIKTEELKQSIDYAILTTEVATSMYVGDGNQKNRASSFLKKIAKGLLEDFIKSKDYSKSEMQSVKKEFFNMMDTAILSFTENNDFETGTQWVRTLYTDEAIVGDDKEHDEIPHYLTNRIASHFLRCSANNVDFDDKFAKEVFPDIKITGENNFEKWNCLAKYFIEQTKNKKYDNAGSYNFDGIIHLRRAKFHDIKRNMKGLSAEELKSSNEKFTIECDNAIKSFTIALIHSADNATYLANRAAVFVMKGQYESALLDIDKALKLDGGSLLATVTKAEIYHCQGKYKEARGLLDSVPVLSVTFLPDQIPEDAGTNYTVARYISHTLSNVFYDGARDEDDRNRARFYALEAQDSSTKSGIVVAAGAKSHPVTDAQVERTKTWSKWLDDRGVGFSFSVLPSLKPGLSIKAVISISEPSQNL